MTSKRINIGAHEFDVEVVSSRKERALGLMHRKDLHFEQGMLFIMRNEPAFFHMMNTEIPLDILFFNDEGYVIKIDQMEPFTGRSKCLLPTAYVVELPMGTCKNLDITVGDRMKTSAKNKKRSSLRIESLLRSIINEMMR